MIAGSIDLHVHCAPDVRPRKMTAVQLAEAARRAGMAGLLLKNHEFSTTALAATVAEVVPDVRVFGGLVLNEAVGGFNPAAVEAAIRTGARQIWMPTHCSEQERIYRGRPGTGLSILHNGGQLRSEVRDILTLIAEADVILGTGHLSASEVYILIGAARQQGIRKILVNHPEIRFLQYPLSLQREVAGPEVWFERCYLRENFAASWAELAAAIRATGCKQNVLATDLGQADTIDPIAGFAQMQSELLGCGFLESELTQLCVTNPASLLNLV